MSSSACRSRAVTGPVPPSPTVQSWLLERTEPTGVMTAAVPQAKTSVISPLALPSRHSSVEIRPASAT